jgi:hypothetical protein
MVFYGVVAALCLIAGFGLGMYEYELRRQIVNAVRSVRPDLDAGLLYASARSLRGGEVLNLYRTHFSDGGLLRRRWIVSLAAPACFVLGAVFLVVAFTRS